MFTVLPAIDVSDGGLAVWTPEGPQPIDAFGGMPGEAARTMVEAGARWIHVVDMDLAFRGVVGAEELVATLAREFPGLAVQVSGGITAPERADPYLAAGAARIVLGSAALADEDLARGIIERLAGRMLVGIEVQDDAIVSRGEAGVRLDLMSTLGWLASSGAPGFLVTSVARVGGREGPDVELIRRVVRAGRPTFAAGGIRHLEDLRAVRRAGAVGAVVGSAAMDGSLDLAEAFAWAAV